MNKDEENKPTKQEPVVTEVDNVDEKEFKKDKNDSSADSYMGDANELGEEEETWLDSL